MKEPLKIKEVAERFRVCYTTVLDWKNHYSPRMPFSGKGRSSRIDASVADEWFRNFDKAVKTRIRKSKTRIRK